ncbi:MAG: outer membrane protein assembly factor BamD [Bdellovibrionota bacterium]
MTKIRLAFLLALSVSLLACSSSDDPDPEVVEIPTGIGATNEGTQEELVYASKRLQEAGIYSVAKENLEALKNNFPQGPYVEFAEIKMADSEFSIRKYSEAAIMYEDFIKDHPSSSAVPYALLKAARSYQLSSRGIGRDTEPLAKAAENYQKLKEEYPDSPYTEAAEKFRTKALSDLAETQKLIMDYYQRQGKTKAYEARKAEFDAEWASLIKSEDELEADLTNTSIAAEGIEPVAESKTVVLAAITHDAEARASMKANQGKHGSPIRRTIPANSPLVQQVKCISEGKPRAAIYFTKALSTEFSNKLGKLESSNGKISLELPAIATRSISVDCLKTKDLRISTDGKLELDYEDSVQVMSLQHPDRLLFLLN